MDVQTTMVAIRTLYHSQEPTAKAQANATLQALQNSVHAWKVSGKRSSGYFLGFTTDFFSSKMSDQLLHNKADVESCYFAAQTLRTKIQTSFSELPEEAHVSLRDSLLEHVASIDENTTSIIVTQLSVAVADLALQMPEWSNFIVDLIQRFGASRPFALLEILVVLPEEVNSRHLRLGSNRREEVIAAFKTSAGCVNEFLQACLAEKADENQQIRFA